MHPWSLPPAPLAELARADAQRALREDVGSGDLTAALIPVGKTATARVLLRARVPIDRMLAFTAGLKRGHAPSSLVAGIGAA